MRTATKVMIGLTTAAVLAGGGWLGDAWVRDRVEERILQRAAVLLPGLTGADVEVAGTLVLPQLARGRLDEVRATAPEVVAQGTTLIDVTVVARDVTLEPTVAGSLEVVGTLAASELAPHLPAGVDLRIAGGEVLLETTVLDLPVRASVDLAVAAGDAVLTVRSLSLAGLEIAVADLPAVLADALTDLRVDLPEPAPGVEVTGVSVLPDGLRLTATGVDVLLQAPGP